MDLLLSRYRNRQNAALARPVHATAREARAQRILPVPSVPAETLSADTVHPPQRTTRHETAPTPLTMLELLQSPLDSVHLFPRSFAPRSLPTSPARERPASPPALMRPETRPPRETEPDGWVLVERDTAVPQ